MPCHQRRRSHPDAANGLSFEREIRPASVSYKHYVTAGDTVLGVMTTNTGTVTNNSTGTVTYFHDDHLGSVVALNDAAGAVIGGERRSFDPWGSGMTLLDPMGYSRAGGSLGGNGVTLGSTARPGVDKSYNSWMQPESTMALGSSANRSLARFGLSTGSERGIFGGAADAISARMSNAWSRAAEFASAMAEIGVDRLDDLQRSPLGHTLQGLPPEGLAVAGLKAGLVGIGKLSAVAKTFRNLAPADEIGPAIIFPAAQVKQVAYSGRLTYVVKESGELVIGRAPHTSLSRGTNVLAAGEARFVNGTLRSLDNASGHYQPSGTSARAAAESAFGRAGFDAAGKYSERSF